MRQFRKAVIGYYGLGEERCMITSIPGAGRDLTEGHIWPHGQAESILLHRFNLSPDDVKDPRNGLLLLTPIEKAFDHKRLCFVYNPFAVSALRLFLSFFSSFLTTFLFL